MPQSLTIPDKGYMFSLLGQTFFYLLFITIVVQQYLSDPSLVF